MQRTSVLLVLAAALAAGPARASDQFLGKTAAEWQKDLTSDKAAVRASAAFALGKIGPDANAALPALTAALRQDKDAAVRDAAAVAVGRIARRGQADAAVIDALCQALAADPDVKVKRSAAVALGQCATDTPQVRAALEKAALDPSKGLKQNAAWALGELCEKAKEPPVAALRAALADADKLVKRDAAAALGKLQAREAVRPAVPDLLACLGHDYLELKKAACVALVELVRPEDVQAAQVLAGVCSNLKEDIEVRFNAALALSNVGGSHAAAAVEILHDVLRVGDLDLKRRAALALRNTGTAGKVAEDTLLTALKHPDDRLRHNAAVALGGIKSTRAVPALVERLADPREQEPIRVSAAVALFGVGLCPEAVAAVPKLLEVLEDPNQPALVRGRVLWALRVHREELLKYDRLFVAMKKVLAEPGLKYQRRQKSGKMLRYDCAFLLGVLKGPGVPEEALPVLHQFLHDNRIRIFTGIGSSARPRLPEQQGDDAEVVEEGTQDGRIMAIKALERVGHDRAKAHRRMIAQLRLLSDGPAFEPEIRDAARTVLEQWGVK
jgi:HEAT repeat protein